jgi:nitroreductase
MTSFNTLARQRFSSRKYLNQPVEEDKLIKVLEAGRIAPSAANKQPWIFYVIRDDKNRSTISSAYHRDWLKHAPVIIVACADHTKAWIRSDGKDHCNIDLAIAIDHMTLQAAELGLATCWICNFNPVRCKEILNLPDHMEPVAIIPLAYPEDSADPNRHITARKPLSDIVRWEF